MYNGSIFLVVFLSIELIFGVFLSSFLFALSAVPNVVRNVKVLNRIGNYVEDPIIAFDPYASFGVFFLAYNEHHGLQLHI